MRIAQLAPLAESVPPKLYGGTERVVAWPVDELVELGHDVTLFASPSFDQGSYLAFLGRLTAEKGPQDAIRIARAAGMPLRIAAKLPRGETVHFKKQLEPHIDGRAVQLVGEVDEAKKQPFLAGGRSPAVSDRLAGAFRPRHDRGDGLWDASDRKRSDLRPAVRG
jgi:glycosyltransferase involved in cell wall biosynthesis